MELGLQVPSENYNKGRLMFKNLVFILMFLCISCTQETSKEKLSTSEFLEETNNTLKKESYLTSIAQWVQSNFITPDTTKIAAEYNARYFETATRLAIESKDYRGKDPKQKRMLSEILKHLTVPSPRNPALNAKLAKLRSELESLYGSGKYCKTPQDCQSLKELEKIIGESRDPDELLEAWNGWRTIAYPMKDKFIQTVELGNQGARDLGFAQMSNFWRTKYDLTADDFENELDRLWGEVKPFYEQLHCYVRSQLNEKYGDEVVPMDKEIPAHLLGNMWAQSWDKIIDIVSPKENATVDITKLLEKNNFDSKKMVKTAENFFVSLGMPELPESFYERSLFEKPADRDVVCHASAWHIDNEDDVRIKMCIEPNEEDFRTIHHELGHIYYYLAYKGLPYVFQGSANDGFHEAIGDTIELSITGKYLKDINLLADEKAFAAESEQALLRLALGKVAFLPFGLMIDKWRWQVFDGRTPPSQYNEHWWKLRRKYQGIRAPNERPLQAFDPGAKYHIPAYTPYSRYFIAHILQFQLHRSLCKEAGHTGPLHECSIFNSQPAGQLLWKMMKMGKSESWPEALEVVTGSKKMDASAIRDYFSPLEKWLKAQNKNLKCGW